MSLLWLVIALVAVQRLGELAYARHNTKRLLARGAQEIGAGHYPLIVILHAVWLLSLVVFVSPDVQPNLPLLVLFLLLQAARVWVLATLGPYWTTRIITLPDAPLVRRGPYRFVRHPNYLIVCLEIAVLPLAFGAWELAILFSLLNGAILYYRISVENQALAGR